MRMTRIRDQPARRRGSEVTLSGALTHHDEPWRSATAAVRDSMWVTRRMRVCERMTIARTRRRERERVEEGRESAGVEKRRRRRRRRREDRYRHFPVSCHVLRRATFELYEETPVMNYSWPSPNLAEAAAVSSCSRPFCVIQRRAKFRTGLLR